MIRWTTILGPWKTPLPRYNDADLRNLQIDIAFEQDTKLLGGDDDSGKEAEPEEHPPTLATLKMQSWIDSLG